MPQNNSSPQDIIDQAAVPTTNKRKAPISPIWMLPIIALLIGLWLVYRAITEAGVSVTLYLDSAQGIVANKTPVIYQGLSVGKVTDVKIRDKLKGVIVKAELQKDIEPLLKKGTSFWIVRPKVSAASISGLETLLSGNYIAFRPGKTSSVSQTTFKVQEHAPPLNADSAGLHITLTSKTLGSLERGSPIFYRQIQVGDIQDYRFSKDKSSVIIDAYIQEKYRNLVHQNSRFWNASGISVSGGLSGLKVRTGSLTSILAGGISFYTPDEKALNVADDGEQFTLFEDFTKAQAGINVSVEFPSGQGIVANSTRVVYQGLQIGVVSSIQLNQDLRTITANLILSPKVEPALVQGTKFWLVEPKLSLGKISGLDTVVRGNYISVQLSDKKNAQPERHFKALTNAPPINSNAPGLHITLYAPNLGSVTLGSPILYQQFNIGSVESFRLNQKKHRVEINVYIKPEYANLVNTTSQFWSVSGIDIKASLQGFNIKTASLASLLSGGITFTTSNLKAKPASKNQLFKLYSGKEQATDKGYPIQIHFRNGGGLAQGSPIRYRDIKVGEVTAVELDKSLQGITAYAKLYKHAEGLAKNQSKFWLVKPELGLTKTEHLDTLIRGVYISVKPQGSHSATHFIAAKQAPTNLPASSDSLVITLKSPRLGSIKPGVKVYYKDVPVGKVIDSKLANLSNEVEIKVSIFSPYTSLVHKNSRFWSSSGIDVSFGLLSGAKIHTQSVESILAGGISFATPDTNMGPIATAKSLFKLYKSPQESWLSWSPKIPLKH